MIWSYSRWLLENLGGNDLDKIRQFTYWNTSTQVVLCVHQSYSEWIGLKDVEIVHISWIDDFRNFTPT